MSSFPPCTHPSPSQLEAIFALLPGHNKDVREEIKEALIADGCTSIEHVGDLDLPPESRLVNTTALYGDEQRSFLVPVEKAGIFVRLDRRLFQDERSRDDPYEDIDIFIYRLEDRAKIEAAIFKQVADEYLARMIHDLGAHCAPTECVSLIRGAIKDSSIGSIWEAEEAARTIQSSIENEMSEKHVSSIIRKAGF